MNWILKLTEGMAPFIAEPICAILNTLVRHGLVPYLRKQAILPKIKVMKNIILISDLCPVYFMPTLATIRSATTKRPCDVLSVAILSTATQMYEKLHFIRLAAGE